MMLLIGPLLPATRIANTIVLFGLLLASSACKPSSPPTNTETHPTNTETHPTNTETHPTNTETHPTNTKTHPTNTETHVEPEPPSPGMPLEPITLPERVNSERNLRPSTFALGWPGVPAGGLPSWPKGSDWVHILLDSEGTPLHLGLSPELIVNVSDATGDVLLTVDGPEQALAITSRFASSWSAQATAHARPSAGTLRCPAQVEGFNLERGDTDCFDQQGGGWFSLAVTCPAGKDYARFYVNVNPILQRGEIALRAPSGAGQVGAVFAEAWSKP